MKTFPQVAERVIHSQPSWVVSNDQLELAVTQMGAHMAPVTFFRRAQRPVQPYYISPWQDENVKVPVPVLGPLRGDFFCIPFGGNSEAFRGERHPPHGEACGSRWKLEDCRTNDETLTLQLSFNTRVRSGRILRELSLLKGHNVVYSRTVIEGFAGPAPFAHHAILALSEGEQSLLCSCSPFRLGRTYPGVFSSPAKGEYQSLAASASFRELGKVPSLFRDEPPADCTAFPTRRGFCDLVQTFEQRAARSRGQQPSWIAAVNVEAGWLWFALKDPRVMPGRVFWMENHGRHSHPWNGRNACLGIEDGCMYFDRGLAESCRPNPISRLGVPTCVLLREGSPFEVRYIQGVARVPRHFGRVRKVTFGQQSATFHSSRSQPVTVPVRHEFLEMLL
jgi:hypothetical protein